VFTDAMVVKIRDGQVTNRPIYTAIGVTVDGRREILGLWAGTGGEGAKFWLQVLTEVKNRGTEDVCIVVFDGLKAPRLRHALPGRRQRRHSHTGIRTNTVTTEVGPVGLDVPREGPCRVLEAPRVP
jgi:hypothetical protein